MFFPHFRQQNTPEASVSGVFLVFSVYEIHYFAGRFSRLQIFCYQIVRYHNY